MAGNRTIITLECKTCKERNYTTTKNKKKTQDKLALSSIARVVASTWTTRKRSSGAHASRNELGQ